ncbi:MAG: hypothetical protein ACJ79E_05170 [Anaeromyxobacteraceae bacterium]
MMTPPWMIEELERRRRELEYDERPALQIELPVEPPQRRESESEPRGPSRGVIVIEL